MIASLVHVPHLISAPAGQSAAVDERLLQAHVVLGLEGIPEDPGLSLALRAYTLVYEAWLVQRTD